MLNLLELRDVYYLDAGNKLKSIRGLVTINNDIIIVKSINKDKIREIIIFKERVIQINKE